MLFEVRSSPNEKGTQDKFTGLCSDVCMWPGGRLICASATVHMPQSHGIAFGQMLLAAQILGHM
jgi:hypothetical protein